MKRALVVGGNSRLGRALVTVLAGERWVVHTTSRRADRGERVLFLDLRDPVLPILPGEGDAVVFIVAAVTGFGACEAGFETWRINADAPGVLARLAPDRGWRSVFVSSDAVEFAPHTAYAKQKAYAELAVLAAGGCVVRPSRIEGPEKYAEVAALLERVGSGLLTLGVPGLVRWPE